MTSISKNTPTGGGLSSTITGGQGSYKLQAEDDLQIHEKDFFFKAADKTDKTISDNRQHFSLQFVVRRWQKIAGENAYISTFLDFSEKQTGKEFIV